MSGGDDEQEERAEDHPLIIAETERQIEELTVGEAVMQLDLSEAPFMIFRNAAHGGLNVVYRRPDGHIGWIEAAPKPQISANGAQVSKVR